LIQEDEELNKDKRDEKNDESKKMKEIKDAGEDVCCHNIIEENNYRYCTFCGNEFTENISYEKKWDTTQYASSHRNNGSNTKVTYMSIKDDLTFMGLNEDIIFLIFETYKKVTENGNKIHRSKYRKSILCACLIHVYGIKKIGFSDNEIIDLFRIEKKDYSKGYKSLRMKVPETRSYQEEVIIQLRYFYTSLNIDKKFYNIIEYIYRTIKNKPVKADNELIFDEGPVFKDKNPKVIAAIVIYYWLEYFYDVHNQKNFKRLSNFCTLQKKYTVHKAYLECLTDINEYYDNFKTFWETQNC
jgi:transcription initiation factor TFIIIB Brf1 subunit/transcription initiation factor TFIIB